MNRTVSDIINEWINACPNISKNIDDIKFYKDETCILKIDYRVYEENRDSLDNIEIDFWYDVKIISNLFSNGIKLVRFKRRVIGEKRYDFKLIDIERELKNFKSLSRKKKEKEEQKYISLVQKLEKQRIREEKKQQRDESRIQELEIIKEEKRKERERIKEEKKQEREKWREEYLRVREQRKQEVEKRREERERIRKEKRLEAEKEKRERDSIREQEKREAHELWKQIETKKEQQRLEREEKLRQIEEEKKTEKNQDTQFKEKMKINNRIYNQKIQERYKNTGILYKAKVDIEDGQDIKYLGSTCPTIKGTHIIGGIKHTSSTFTTLVKYHDIYSGYYEHNLSLSSAYAFEDEKYIDDILKEFGY